MKATELSNVGYVADPSAKTVQSIFSSMKEGESRVIAVDPNKGVFSTGSMVTEYTPTQWANRETRFIEAEERDAIAGYVDLEWYNPTTKSWEADQPENWTLCKVTRRYRRLGADGNGISCNNLVALSRYRRAISDADIPSNAIVFDSFADEKSLQKAFLALAAEHYKDAENVTIKVKLEKVLKNVNIKNRKGEVVFKTDVEAFTFA